MRDAVGGSDSLGTACLRGIRNGSTVLRLSRLLVFEPVAIDIAMIEP